MAQQNLDFNIVAHTKGMEAIATLINRVGALEAETKRLASANQTLSASTETVIRNNVRYNNSVDAQSKALRQQRQGTQQLGMQMNDFATSVSSGTSVQQAFAQQLGQVGYAMSMMEGTAGKVGAFLAGPFGGLIVIASLALSSLAEKFFTVGKSAKELEKIEQDLVQGNIDILEARASLDKALGRNTNSYLKAKVAALEAAKEELASAISASNAAQIRMQAAAKEAQFLDRLQKRMAASGGQYGGALGYIIKKGAQATGYGDLEGAVNEANAQTADLQKATAKLINATAGVRNALKGDNKKDGRSGKSDAERAAEKLKKEQEAIAKNIADVNIKADKEWRDYWVKAEQDQMVGLQEKLADMQTMATATVETVGQTAGTIFLDRAKEIQDAFASIGMAVNNAFKGMLSGAMSWKDGIKGIIGAVIDELWRLYVVQQIVGFVTKAIGGVTGNPGPSVDTAVTVTRGRAVGGYVAAQTPYVVGEKGPELFVPGGSGTIIPNKNMGMGGGGSGVTINVDARGSSDPAAVRAQVQQGIMEAAPAIIAAAQARTVSGLRRPRLGGAMQ